MNGVLMHFYDSYFVSLSDCCMWQRAFCGSVYRLVSCVCILVHIDTVFLYIIWSNRHCAVPSCVADNWIHFEFLLAFWIQIVQKVQMIDIKNNVVQYLLIILNKTPSNDSVLAVSWTYCCTDQFHFSICSSQ